MVLYCLGIRYCCRLEFSLFKYNKEGNIFKMKYSTIYQSNTMRKEKYSQLNIKQYTVFVYCIQECFVIYKNKSNHSQKKTHSSYS